MQKGNVSILMPVYAPDPTFLKAAIDSVLHQSYPHWTLHIQEDPSDTDTEAIVRPYLSDSRITFTRNPKRLGIGGNWNSCLRGAKGEFVQFLFQDDLWYRTYLEENVSVFKRDPSTGMTACAHDYRAESDPQSQEFFLNHDVFQRIRTYWKKHIVDGKRSGEQFLLEWLKMGLSPNLVGEPSFVMFRRSVMQRVGLFREALYQGLDREYWVRALCITNIHFLTQELGIFRIHTAATTMQNENVGRGMSDLPRSFERLFAASTPPLIRKTAQDMFVEHTAMRIQRAMRRHGKETNPAAGQKHPIPLKEVMHLLMLYLSHPCLSFRILWRVLRPMPIERSPVRL